MLRASHLPRRPTVDTPTGTCHKTVAKRLLCRQQAGCGTITAVSPRGGDVFTDDVAADVRRLDAPVGVVAEHHGERDEGMLGRRVADEPAVADVAAIR